MLVAIMKISGLQLRRQDPVSMKVCLCSLRPMPGFVGIGRLTMK